MGDCSGLMGIVFGHRFRTFELVRTPGDPAALFEFIREYGAYWTPWDVQKTIDSLASKTYTVVCTRCGASGDEQGLPV